MLLEAISGHWILLTIHRTARAVQKEPSNYIQTLTQYLSNIMTTVLLGLPAEIKELLYFNALSYAATKILVSALDDGDSELAKQVS